MLLNIPKNTHHVAHCFFRFSLKFVSRSSEPEAVHYIACVCHLSHSRARMRASLVVHADVDTLAILVVHDTLLDFVSEMSDKSLNRPCRSITERA